MRVGIAINDTWAYFNDIFEMMKTRYITSVFNPKTITTPLLHERINRKYYRNQLNQLLATNQVVFFEWAGEYLAQATALPKQCGIVSRLHRYELYHWAEHISWEKVDRLILVSHAKEAEIVSEFPELNGKTSVIFEGINLTRFPFQPKPFQKRLGILGHLTPRKRVYELILAFKEFNLSTEGFSLHVGGGEHPRFKDYYQSIQALIISLELEESVRMYNHVDSPQEWFSEVDIFISNSYSEGLQISPMEAMASGCYCLSHAWPGSQELLPADNIFITNSQLISKIHSFASLTPEQQLNSITNLRSVVENNFDLEKISEKILLEIDSVGQKYA